MKSKLTYRVLAVAAGVMITLGFSPVTVFAQGTAFTYQGRLNDGANPANGTYDLRFQLNDAVIGGNQWGQALTNSAVTVSNGLFTTTLDFGFGVLTGGPRWLQVSVRTNGGSGFVVLAPRTALLPAPYAVYSASAAQATTISGTVPGSGLNGLYSNPVNFSSAANNFAGDGTGLLNVNAATLNGVSSAGFWKTTGNTGANPANGAFLGTTDNLPVELRVNGERVLRLEPVAPAVIGLVSGPNTVGGWSGNQVANGAIGATVWGGGPGFFFDTPNIVGGDFATVSGGRQNSANDAEATVAGGRANSASGANATVSGGYGNTASGSYATVPGGIGNAAGGQASLAAGNRSKALHDGTFVWADSIVADFSSTATNQFLIRATGGVGINNNNPNGAALAVNGDMSVTGNFKGGYPGNVINNGVVGAFIGGGGNSTYPNSVGANYGSVVGGVNNRANGIYATAMGGGSTASGGYSTAMGASIASGEFSTAMGYLAEATGYASTAMGESTASGDYSTAMGLFSTASGDYSTAMGNSVATGPHSTATGYSTASGGVSIAMGGSRASGAFSIAMGYSTASGDYSTAIGLNASATNFGSFVWADASSLYTDFTSSGNNQFCIRARGGIQLDPLTSQYFGSQTRQMLNLYGTGYGIGVQNNTTYFRCANFDVNSGFIWYKGGVHSDGYGNAGGGIEMMHLVASGLYVNGTFVSSSDRNAKENFAPIQPRDVLEKVVALPLSSWNYKADTATRHLGPMAQDFYAAFGVGPDDKHIATIDESGVALAAIQGLNQKLEETRSENAELKQQLSELKRLVQTLVLKH